MRPLLLLCALVVAVSLWGYSTGKAQATRTLGNVDYFTCRVVRPAPDKLAVCATNGTALRDAEQRNPLPGHWRSGYITWDAPVRPEAPPSSGDLSGTWLGSD